MPQIGGFHLKAAFEVFVLQTASGRVSAYHRHVSVSVKLFFRFPVSTHALITPRHAPEAYRKTMPSLDASIEKG